MVLLKYIVFHVGNKDLELTCSDPYEDPDVRNWDKLLHRTLSNIFRKRRYSSGQINKLLPADEISILDLILEREPRLGKLLIKKNELSFLWIAILSNYQKSAELLVRYGADVNKLYKLRSLFGITEESNLLHALLRMYPSAWNKRLIGLLIEHGANFIARDSSGYTVLHMAVKNGRVKMVENLLDRGADVNVANKCGVTPLLEAAGSKEVEELVPLLMRHGADVTVRDNDGENVLRYLVTNDNGEYVDLARVLIEKGASPCKTDTKDLQPIHRAVKKNKIKLVNLFLDHGANVNASSEPFGAFPLYIAADVSEEMMYTLLKRGANIDQKTTFFFTETALHVVKGTDKNAMAKIKLLLSVGADIFAENREGLTPFEIYRRENMESPVIKLMLKTLALRKACLEPSIEFEDERFIKEYPEQWNQYQDCLEEIIRMKTMTLINSCTFFDLLTQCPFHMIALIKNREFKKQFMQLDLSTFPLYAEDLLEAFDRAEHYYQSSILDQENLIYEAVYNALPHVVVRKVVSEIFKFKSCEICELKRIVQASRSVS